jgi:hypothetical protein
MLNERRQFLAVGAALTATGILAGCGGASAAPAPAPLPYPDIADTSAATPELVAFMKAFFAAKSRAKLDETMSFLSPDLINYSDVTLGAENLGWAAIRATFARLMPNWPATALSYPTRLVGDMTSALVAFTDTPELFGGELRILGTVDFKDGKIVRWLDFWDARGFPNTFGLPFKTLAVPAQYYAARVGENADPRLQQVAHALVTAMSTGNVGAAAALFASDAIYEDMVLRNQIQGRLAISRYLTRSLALLPHGMGCTYSHSVGSSQGGAVEWFGAGTTLVRAGVTALLLDQSGLITRATSIYDGNLLTSAQVAHLISLGVDG